MTYMTMTNDNDINKQKQIQINKCSFTYTTVKSLGSVRSYSCLENKLISLFWKDVLNSSKIRAKTLMVTKKTFHFKY